MANYEYRNGSYRIRVSAGYDGTGKQIIKRTTWKPEPGMTEKQIQKALQKKMLEFEEQVKNGGYIDASNIRLTEFCDQYLETAETFLAPNTLKFYKYVINTMIRPMLGHMKLRDIRPIHLQQFINQLSGENARSDGKGGKLSPATIKRDFTVVKSIMAKAYKLGLIENNPSDSARLDMPQVEEPEVEIFTREEAIEMLSCLDEEPLFFQVIVQLALTTGARRGELIALTWDCIDFQSGLLSIKQSAYKPKGEDTKNKAPKTKGSVRTIAIPESVLALLQEYRKEQIKEQMRLGDAWQGGNWLFTQWDGKQMNPMTPTKQFEKFLKRHGIPHRKFHALRHTSATLLLANGTDIKTVGKRLGHTQLATTNRYVHALRDADEAAAQSFATILQAPITSKEETVGKA